MQGGMAWIGETRSEQAMNAKQGAMLKRGKGKKGKASGSELGEAFLVDPSPWVPPHYPEFRSTRGRRSHSEPLAPLANGPLAPWT